MSGKNCCRCGKEISFWNVFKATWPTRVFCPHCKAKNSYRYAHLIGFLSAIATLFLAFLSLIIASIAVSETSPEGLVILWFIIIFIALFELFLLLTTPALRRFGHLIAHK
jgi:hypothetical protein